MYHETLNACAKRKVNEQRDTALCGVTGHRVWDPPDPIPNSEVKPRSVSGVSVVFGHVKPEKLVPHFKEDLEISRFITW